MSIEIEMTRTGFSLWAAATQGFEAGQLADDPLVISGDPFAGLYHVTEDDIAWPAFPINRTYAPDSDVIGGRVHKSATVGEGTIGLKIAAHGGNTAATLAAMDALMVCTSQFTYTLQLRVNGAVYGTYEAKAELPLWGALDSGMVRAEINEATISIPINPPGGA